MDEMKQIPQNIWETDCKYCTFRASEENFEYGSRGNYDTPCRIHKYDGKSRIWNEETKEFDLTEHEAYKEHCPTCRPTEGFGICATCEYFNGFHDGAEDETAIYCTLIDGPVNRRNTMPHINAGYSKEITHFHYSYFTCDRYTVNRGPYMGKDRLLDLAVKGRIPKNFDPDTFEPLEYMEGVPIEQWQARQQAYEDSKPENIKKRKLQDAIRQKIKKAAENSETDERKDCQ